MTSYSWCKKSCNCWDRTRACKEWDLCHITNNMTSAQDVMLPKDADGKPQCQCIVQSSGKLKFSSAHLSRRQVTKFQSFFFCDSLISNLLYINLENIWPKNHQTTSQIDQIDQMTGAIFVEFMDVLNSFRFRGVFGWRPNPWSWRSGSLGNGYSHR